MERHSFGCPSLQPSWACHRRWIPKPRLGTGGEVGPCSLPACWTIRSCGQHDFIGLCCSGRRTRYPGRAGGRDFSPDMEYRTILAALGGCSIGCPASLSEAARIYCCDRRGSGAFRFDITGAPFTSVFSSFIADVDCGVPIAPGDFSGVKEEKLRELQWSHQSSDTPRDSLASISLLRWIKTRQPKTLPRYCRKPGDTGMGEPVRKDSGRTFFGMSSHVPGPCGSSLWMTPSFPLKCSLTAV